MDIAFLERLDLATFEKICLVLFDQMGFAAQVTGAGSMPGIGKVMVLSSKSSKAPFALLQCAEVGVRVEVAQLTQIKESMAKLGLNNGYLVSVGTPSLAARDFAASNKINLVDGDKFVELIKNLSETGRTLLRQAMAPNRVAKPAETSYPEYGTGRYPKLAGTTRAAGVTGPPTCAKCGTTMKLQIKRDGMYKTGNFWQCPRTGCGYISAYLEQQS